jgi:uncharacterized repeat protein (TIGR03803 family)
LLGRSGFGESWLGYGGSERGEAETLLGAVAFTEQGAEHMGTSDLGRYALNVCVAVMLAGCGNGSGTPLSASPASPSTALRVTKAERTRPSVTYGVLYSFQGGSADGESPDADLLDVKGLYGTTFGGGANGEGIVFVITTAGAETVLHSFPSGSGDGERPAGGLIKVKSKLYSTTLDGGANDDGTVYSVTTSGKESVLYSFGRSGDGKRPGGGLLNVKGTLYGTTCCGGANSDGTVFSVTTSGTEIVLHSFGGSGDGEDPVAGLINVKGTLYGTTDVGGANGYGTVFTITPSGTETVIYSFKGGSADGAYPQAGLVDVNGTLYGTTNEGGATCGASGGCGTVFSITPSGKETVIHTFPTGSGDGEYPDATLIAVKGQLYGTTCCGGASGYGTVFAIAFGVETVLHSFPTGSYDGEDPVAGLTNVKGTLYGTTDKGGANGGGTVFRLSP